MTTTVCPPLCTAPVQRVYFAGVNDGNVMSTLLKQVCIDAVVT